MIWLETNSVFPEYLYTRPTTPIYLSTQIVPKDKALSWSLWVQEGSHFGSENYYHLRLGLQLAESKEIHTIGYLGYQICSETIRVGDIQNESSYCSSPCLHVGNALHEIAFRKSMALGKNGHLCLGSTPNAVFFHFKWGFSPTTLEHTLCLFSLNPELQTLCHEYSEASSQNNESQMSAIEKKIRTEHEENYRSASSRAHELYPELASYLSFVEILQYGFYKKTTDFLQDYIAASKGRRVASPVNQGLMYLPDSVIKEKQKLFGFQAENKKQEHSTSVVPNSFFPVTKPQITGEALNNRPE